MIPTPGERFATLLEALKYHAANFDAYRRPTYDEIVLPEHLVGTDEDTEASGDEEVASESESA
jgi:hypothetical protein